MTARVLENVWRRPAMILFTESLPVAQTASIGRWDIGSAGTYMYLTDDNRSDLQIGFERIEYKKRMIDGRMRSYHVADKKSFSMSWNNIPSKAQFISEVSIGGAASANWGAGSEIVNWHKDHTGSFYMMLVYDSPSSSVSDIRYRTEIYNVFFDSISNTVKQRGTAYDLWDVTVSLVEV